MEEWGNFISTIGFPVFITTYLLVRLEKIINKMMDSLEELKELLREK
ncbi:YvrJ family protein [Desemzia sp. FAM 23989]